LTNGKQEIAKTRREVFRALIDIYLLRRFLAYSAVDAGIRGPVPRVHFLRIMGRYAKHGVPFLTVVRYFWYLTPYLLYQLSPLWRAGGGACYAGRDEQEQRDCGVQSEWHQLYRLAIPLLLAGLTLAATE